MDTLAVLICLRGLHIDAGKNCNITMQNQGGFLSFKWKKIACVTGAEFQRLGGRAATTMNTYGIPAVTAKPTTTEHKYMFVQDQQCTFLIPIKTVDICSFLTIRQVQHFFTQQNAKFFPIHSSADNEHVGKKNSTHSTDKSLCPKSLRSMCIMTQWFSQA